MSKENLTTANDNNDNNDNNIHNTDLPQPGSCMSNLLTTICIKQH